VDNTLCELEVAALLKRRLPPWARSADIVCTEISVRRSPKLRQGGVQLREHWSLSEGRKDSPRFSQMLGRKRALFLGLVKQAE
jgi:hypothetical protein